MLDSIAVIAPAAAAAKLAASRPKTARCTPAELVSSASSQPASYKTSASGLSGAGQVHAVDHHGERVLHGVTSQRPGAGTC
jgi:hypothetical protein